MLFFRSRPGDDHGDLGDLVHQTAMYYEDRLGGQRFDRVRLAGWARTLGSEPGTSAAPRRAARDADGSSRPQGAGPVRLPDRASPELLDQVAPLVGILMRDRVASPAGAR